ncbi:hypothetical protein Godav_002869, partial [Gossypium davidsonii]|nr:hypothetical protein [Gossypium davidsonii]
EDKQVWRGKPCGEHSVRSGYRLLLEESAEVEPTLQQCTQEDESLEHAFRDYQAVKEIWSMLDISWPTEMSCASYKTSVKIMLEVRGKGFRRSDSGDENDIERLLRKVVEDDNRWAEIVEDDNRWAEIGHLHRSGSLGELFPGLEGFLCVKALSTFSNMRVK